MTARALAARLSYRLVTRAPASAVGRARTAAWIAPVLEAGYAAVGSPLFGSVVRVAAGPAAGLQILAERRSLAWLSGRIEPEVQAAVTTHLPVGGPSSTSARASASSRCSRRAS